MNTVYPLDQVDSGLARKLAEEHPQAYIILHPVFSKWLLFEAPKGTRWTPETLSEAMKEHHAKVVNGQPYATPKWVNDRGAPVMRDELPRRPGSWLLEWLNKNDLWRHPGGSKAWLDEIEAEEKRRDEEPRKQIEAMNYEATKETMMPIHLADALRGDTIKRKWRDNALIDFKEEPNVRASKAKRKIRVAAGTKASGGARRRSRSKAG
jgi:hypothetical protein